jgi:hypothetical protein
VEALGTAAGFIFTLMIFSYLLGDNRITGHSWLYRLAVYVFIGLAAAFTTIVTFESVIIPLITAVSDGNTTAEDFLGIVSLIVAPFLTLPLLIQRLPGSGLAMAFLVAVGAAVAVLGAITGTLFPLTLATSSAVQGDVVNGVIMVVGVVTSLLYFQYLARRTPEGRIERGAFGKVASAIGQGFIVVTLGALYGAAILTSLTILTGRVSFLVRGGS